MTFETLFIVPVDQDGEATDTRPSLHEHYVSDVPSRPMRLLIVDDNARVRR